MRRAGHVLVGRWEVRAGRLCDACLSSRSGAWTGTSALLGWWGAMSFFRTLRVLPSNLLELRLAKAAPPLPHEPTDGEIAAEEERVVRRSAAFEALAVMPMGLLLAALGGCLVRGHFDTKAREGGGFSTRALVAAWVLGLLGLLLRTAAVLARRNAFRGPLPPPEHEPAPTPEPLAESTSPTRATRPQRVRRRRTSRAGAPRRT